MTQLTNNLNSLAQSQLQTNNNLESLVQSTNAQMTQLTTNLNQLIETLGKNGSTNNNNNNGGSTPMTPPAVPETAPSSNGKMSLAQACAFLTQQTLTKRRSKRQKN